MLKSLKIHHSALRNLLIAPLLTAFLALIDKFLIHFSIDVDFFKGLLKE